ncbi:MAG TPA: tripartite tricarboxylate transporter TctB family protein [Gammaproteobacteria bacterium]|nr:tripartite tricarboxylate transporter TctB family protein [Gammaproteobacteria bacterium]
MTRDRASALVLLALFLGYGWMATGIEMFPGAEADPFTPQTLPKALTVLGAVLAIALLITRPKEDGAKRFASAFAGFQWDKVIQLMVVMVLYALALVWLGFLLATVLFLAAGFWILGIRSLRTIVLGAVPLSLGFWLVLAKLLDIYLAPGEVWYLLGLE